jgi:hypothetical protein
MLDSPGSTKPETPYPPPEGAKPKTLVEEKTAGAGVPTQEELADFLKTVGGQVGSADTASDDAEPPGFQKPEQKVEYTNATLEKVAAFLNPQTRGPVTLLVKRHKMFLMHIPTQQEILDVSAISGIKPLEEPTQTQFQWQIIGELRVACYGWVPEQSPEAQTLRANIAWPKLWPELRRVTWTDSRDPFIFSDEIMPLYQAYLAWRETVVPSRGEIDFYWASQR